MHPPTPSPGRHIPHACGSRKNYSTAQKKRELHHRDPLPVAHISQISSCCCCCNTTITMVHPTGDHIGCHHPQHRLLHLAHPFASSAAAAHAPQHKEKAGPTPAGFNCQRSDNMPTNSKSSITSSTTATATTIERRCLYCRRRVFKSERGRTLHHRRCRRIYVDRWKKVKVVCDIKLMGYVSLFY